MADVFLSYKRENKAKVQAVVEGLRAAGLRVWWDQDIPPDAPWEATIERELQEAKAVVVAWSEASLASENVKAEARRARTQGKLIQIFMEPCEPPLFFGERQGVDLSTWPGDFADPRFQAVAAAAKALRDGRPAPQGVGYAPRKRGPGPLLAVAAVVAVLGVGGVAALLTRGPTPAEPGTVTAAAEIEAAAGPLSAEPSPPPAQAVAVAPAVELGVRHELVIPSGHAVDFESGGASASLSEASDFVVSSMAVDFAIAAVAAPAAVGVATGGAPTPASCAIEPARPSMDWQVPMPNDVGEHQCFVTREGRKGALILLRGSDASAVRIAYELWP